ncbi:hypothetical protein I7I50_09317 [Histoplasma capsulatum G186AR]|uniref:Uncharacterized protein n=1 Tax=Ajellomyces capsulatus TaxID=5037 RepID=A0A8H7YS87_AJECA|nr:hypothetical protein I7I52_06838 [Histoplasma capsulatum]QSS74228.1 hypothetical protein I7I50_09317 [Histoplasma capsulatum G186AR]
MGSWDLFRRLFYFCFWFTYIYVSYVCWDTLGIYVWPTLPIYAKRRGGRVFSPQEYKLASIICRYNKMPLRKTHR